MTERDPDADVLQAYCSACKYAGTMMQVWGHCRASKECKSKGGKAIVQTDEDGRVIHSQLKSTHVSEPVQSQPSADLPTRDDTIRAAEQLLGGVGRQEPVDDVVSRGQRSEYTMAELAAGFGGGGSNNGYLDEDDEIEEPEEPFGGQPVSPTLLLRDGTVHLPAHLVGIYDSFRTDGYLRTLTDFAVEWMTIGLAVSGIDIRALPVSDNDRTLILRALGVTMDGVAV